MKKTGLFILFLLLLSQIGWSQQFANAKYGRDLIEMGKKCLVQNDSTLLLMGRGSEQAFVLYKVKTNGDTIFSRYIRMPFATYGTDIVTCPNGDAILIGFYGGLAKVDGNGNVLWTINNKTTGQRAGVLLSDTTFAVVGSRPVFSHMQMMPDLGLDSIFVNKIHVGIYHTLGKLLKEQIFTFGANSIESATDVLYSTKGALVVNGYTYQNGMPNNFLLSLAPDLTINVDTVFKYPGIYSGNSIIENSKGNYGVCGYKYISQANDFDMFIQELNDVGEILWEKIIDLKGSEVGTAMLQSGGYYYVAGNTSNNRNITPNYSEIILLKLNLLGDTIWSRIYTLPKWQEATDIQELNDSTLVILGSTNLHTTCKGANPDFECPDFYLMYVNKENGSSNLNPQVPSLVGGNNKVVIYPNPSNGVVKIKGEGIRSVKICNLVGKVINTIQTTSSKQEVEISVLGKGIYYMLIETDNGLVNKRFVVL